ncbi:hypothetical protein [Fimbriimonas ginsengisoli]|uniref:Type IV pilus biogenesis protein PilP n=1 Tax=Fimbriimonas ginsengisoli Gsoil 348 TaxID=661478 RepID=A0A068NQD2_FIMGI|nr:hypothetical protein [Fimbriimonas ginsengisoli]AIE85778.1 hypothetical protein OP10G_2410 [Fimbriimonas ginsengisoli Gsoil 348]
MNKSLQILALSGVLVAVVGCGAPEPPLAAPTVTLPAVKVNFSTEAGVPPTDGDPKMNLVAIRRAAARSGGARSDPFALRPDEQQFEKEQNMERMFAENGTFQGPQFEPKDAVVVPPPVVEPQPYRRLAGIVVGDSVLAIIDMGNGSTELIRPGMKVPGTEWTVVSIDEEKAVLRRAGNRLPKQIVVRLELPPAGIGGNNGAPAGGGFKGPGGGPGPGGGAPADVGGGLGGNGG